MRQQEHCGMQQQEHCSMRQQEHCGCRKYDDQPPEISHKVHRAQCTWC